MKKIVSAVALASLVAGAFAADVTIKSQIKYQPTVAEFDSAKDYKVNTFAKQPDTKDTFQINIKQDNVRVQGKFDATSSAVKVNTAYGDVKIGNATITAGILESRFTNAVTNDANDESFIANNKGDNLRLVKAGGTDWVSNKIAAGKKLGVNPNLVNLSTAISTANNKKSPVLIASKAGQDSDCVTDLQGSKVSSIVFDYTLADVGPGKLLLKAVAKANADAWSSTGDDATKTDTTTNNSGYSFEAAYTMNDVGTFDFVTNLDSDNEGSLAFFANIGAVENLSTVFGFTYAWFNGYHSVAKQTWLNTTDDAKNYKFDDVYWAIDARARYAINDQLAAGIYANLTNVSSKVDDSKVLDGVNILDLVLNANYKVNDLATVFVEGEYSSVLTEQDGTKESNIKIGSKYGYTTVAAQLGAVLTPAKGCTITTAVKAAFNGIGAGSENGVDYKDYCANVIQIPLTVNFNL